MRDIIRQDLALLASILNHSIPGRLPWVRSARNSTHSARTSSPIGHQLKRTFTSTSTKWQIKTFDGLPSSCNAGFKGAFAINTSRFSSILILNVRNQWKRTSLFGMASTTPKCSAGQEGLYPRNDACIDRIR